MSPPLAASAHSMSQFAVVEARVRADPAPVWLTALVAGFVLATRELEIDFEALLWGVSDMAEYFGRFGSPDFTRIDRYMVLMLETVAMAIWGTALALKPTFLE